MCLYAIDKMLSGALVTEQKAMSKLSEEEFEEGLDGMGLVKGCFPAVDLEVFERARDAWVDSARQPVPDYFCANAPSPAKFQVSDCTSCGGQVEKSCCDSVVGGLQIVCSLLVLEAWERIFSLGIMGI